jgi:hypothetical protein
MDTNNFCNSVVTIPQTAGTCWFNALLMMIFYSQNSRKLLLHYNKFKDRKDELSVIFKTMLYKSYIKDPKIFDYLMQQSPQKILSLLKFEKRTTDGKLIENNLGMHINNYVYKLLDFLEVDYLTLDCFDLKNNVFYLGISEMMKYNYTKGKNNKINIFFNYDNYLDRTEFYLDKFDYKVKNQIPKYLVINLLDKKGGFHKYVSSNPHYFNYFIFQNTIKGLNKLPNEINFKGYTYILDSVSLENYNKNVPYNHAICGITCKNKRYVYNGWMRTTKDPAMLNAPSGNKSYPCELMPFDWDVHKSNNFCLNTPLCKLDQVLDARTKQLCFSFDKHERTVIYVLKDKDFKSLDYNLSSSSILNKSKSHHSPIPVIEINDKDDNDKDDDNDKEKCPDDKIYNPRTKRCVLKSGKIGQLLLKGKGKENQKKVVKVKDDKKVKKEKGKCPDDKIYNPETKRCVLKSGKIGQLLMKMKK